MGARDVAPRAAPRSRRHRRSTRAHRRNLRRRLAGHGIRRTQGSQAHSPSTEAKRTSAALRCASGGVRGTKNDSSLRSRATRGALEPSGTTFRGRRPVTTDGGVSCATSGQSCFRCEQLQLRAGQPSGPRPSFRHCDELTADAATALRGLDRTRISSARVAVALTGAHRTSEATVAVSGGNVLCGDSGRHLADRGARVAVAPPARSRHRPATPSRCPNTASAPRGAAGLPRSLTSWPAGFVIR